MWIFSVVFGGIADRLLDAGKISNLAIRKISMSIGVFGPMLGLIAMCFVNCDGALAMGVLCVAVGLNGAVYSGFMSSHQDLSPNLASSLLGLSNTVATIPGFVSPVVTGSITDGNETLSAWRTVFLISVGTYLVSNIFYLVFISTDIQPWNEQNPKTVPGQNYELPSVLLDHEMEEGDTKERY
ncbi:putative inorganic phosphate cotransporter [Cherax quadricarinatus]